MKGERAASRSLSQPDGNDAAEGPFQRHTMKAGIKEKGSVEVLHQATLGSGNTKGVQVLWLLFSIYTLSSLSSRYLW